MSEIFLQCSNWINETHFVDEENRLSWSLSVGFELSHFGIMEMLVLIEFVFDMVSPAFMIIYCDFMFSKKDQFIMGARIVCVKVELFGCKIIY